VMRAGSGAVLLVGFALVVMLLSVAGALTSPVVGMKQDPSQDFADIAGSIKEMTQACGNFRGTDEEKQAYFNASLEGLAKKFASKGIIMNAYPMVTGGKCSVLYELKSNDGSTDVQGFVSTDEATENAWRQYLSGGIPSSLSSMIVIPPALCFSDTGHGQGVSNTNFLIGNPNPIKINVIMTYVGSDSLQKLDISFPGEGEGTAHASDGVLQFYLYPMTQPKGKGVALGQRNIGYASIGIRHTSKQSGLVDKLVITIPEYNFTQEVPIYWNTCPVVPWGQILSRI